MYLYSKSALSRKNCVIFSLLISCLLLISPITASGQSATLKGLYFPIKSYQPSDIPVFAENKDKLPIPILGSDKHWLELYWFCWEMAFKNIRKPEPGSPFVSNYIDEAFSPNLFQWDTHFMLLFWKYAHHIFPAIRSHDNFYSRQHSNGYICREIRESNGTDVYFEGINNTVNPPLFSWIEYEYYRFTGDKERLKTVIPALEKYGEWIEQNRKKKRTKHHLYWQTNLGSGMDNSPRKGSGWVDLSAQMAMHYHALSMIEIITGKVNNFLTLKKMADSIRTQIQHFMWNEDDGLYYDVNDAGEQQKVKTVACFWPMLARASYPEHVQDMIKHLEDPASFWREIPFPSLAADHPQYHSGGNYWRGSVWAPTNYMIIKGLEQYRFHDFAATATAKYLDGMHAVFRKTQTVWENYAPDTLQPGKPAQKDFVGWTGLGPIALLIENIIGIHAYGADNQILWNILRTDEHGLENLTMKDYKVSLRCQERASADHPATLSIDSGKPFTLVVFKGEQIRSFQVKAGKNKFTF